MNYPDLIVFDFHGTLSLKEGRSPLVSENLFFPCEKLYHINDLKKILRRYKNDDSWYKTMIKAEICPEIMMPTLNDIIMFINNIKIVNPDIIFSIASMIEDEKFIYDMMRYCFDSKKKENPFNQNNIVGFQSLSKNKLNSLCSKDKTPHINIILSRLDRNITNIVLVDNDSDVIATMSKLGVRSVYVEEFFTIEDWNKSI